MRRTNSSDRTCDNNIVQSSVTGTVVLVQREAAFVTTVKLSLSLLLTVTRTIVVAVTTVVHNSLVYRIRSKLGHTHGYM